MSSRMRKTRGKTGHGRSHIKVTSPRLSKCTNCGEEHLRHRMCENCGHYRDVEVVDMEARMEKKLKRLRRKRKERGEEPVQEGDEEMVKS